MYSPNSSLYEKAVGDTLVLAPADEHGLPVIDHALCLAGVAVDVWHLLQAGESENEIVCKLVEEYDVGEADLRRDIHGFLRELVEKELIRDES